MRNELCLTLAGVIGFVTCLPGTVRTAVAAETLTPMGSESNRPIAAVYYFPNWHRQPGQTGELFGEWGNLQRAIPRFPGHQQPKQPVWGMQDEADPKVMAGKIAAAADHGIGAFIFCWYYHEQGPYLDRALNEGYLRATNRARVPFALMWANHDVGAERKGAVPRPVFERMADLLVSRYFKDPSYWRLSGRCYFSLYEPETFIDGVGGLAAARVALDDLRARARRAGCGEVHLNLIDYQVGRRPDRLELIRALGADSVTSYVWIHSVALEGFPKDDYDRLRRAYFRLRETRWEKFPVPHFPNATMGWDSTPRVPPDQPTTGKLYPDTPVLWGNTPEAFHAALQQAHEAALRLPPGPRVVTIYAWNEWTEGGYLEPEAATGMKYLEAVRDVFK